MKRLLYSMFKIVHSTTSDNGNEFGYHEKTTKRQKYDLYLPIRILSGNENSMKIPTVLSDNTFLKSRTLEQ